MPTPKLDKAKFIADLKRVARQLGRQYISSGEYERGGGLYASTNGAKHFGSWAAALHEAGLSAPSTRHARGVESKLHAQLEAAEKELELHRGLASHKPRTFSIRPRKATKHEATAIAIASDWHIEEPVDPESMEIPGGYLNEYNMKIAKDRAERFFAGILKLVEIERHVVQIQSLVLGLLGDFISGYIHEELEENNEASPLEAIEACEDYLCSGIDYLLKEGQFRKIVVPCTFGNHGRTVKKPRIATGAANNFERHLYRDIAKRYQGDQRIEFTIANGKYVYVDVYGLRLRFSHGDDIKGGGGVGGLSIPLLRAITRRNNNRMLLADYDFLGHHHQLGIHGGNVIVNGSLIGYNAFAQQINAGFEPPQQAFCLLDSKRRCISSFRPIWVDDPKETKR